MASRKLQVLWSDAADLDLGRAIEHLNEQDPRSARELVRGITRAVASLEEHPELGSIVDLGVGGPYRQLVCGRYRIFYRIQENALLIVRVWDSRRDPRNLKLE